MNVRQPPGEVRLWVHSIASAVRSAPKAVRAAYNQAYRADGVNEDKEVVEEATVCFIASFTTLTAAYD